MKQEGIEAYMNQERLEVVLKVAIHVTSKVSKYFAEVLSNSLLIPKPKFKVGDKVKAIYGEKTKWEIEGRYYSPDEMKWYYSDFGDMIDHSEDELELVEAV